MIVPFFFQTQGIGPLPETTVLNVAVSPRFFTKLVSALALTF